MRIHGKGKFNHQMLEKIEKGADGIEIHLESELLFNNKPLDEIFDLSYVDIAPIYVIHMPLTDDDVNIETQIGKIAIQRVAELANFVAQKQNHNVLIVAHLSTGIKRLKDLGIYESVKTTVLDIIEKYDNIEIGIENVTIFHQGQENFYFCDCIFFDNIQFVKDCNHPRIGTVLDTCHVLENEAMLEFLKPFVLSSYISQGKPFNYDMETFFKKNKKYCKLIHLANMNYNGLMENHGTPFLEKDIPILSQIISLYNQYDYSCPITIEVKEKDYSNSINFLETLKNLKKLI